jgi:hypothetical protein
VNNASTIFCIDRFDAKEFQVTSEGLSHLSHCFSSRSFDTMMMSFESPTKGKKRPLPSQSPRQLSPPWPHSASAIAAERVSPTLAFKRLRVSEELLQGRSPPPSFLSQTKSDQRTDHQEYLREYYSQEGSGGRFEAASTAGGTTSTFHNYDSAAAANDDELAEEECYSYSPVNHFLGDLHRQRLMRRETEAQQSRASSFASASSFGGVHHSSGANSHHTPPPAGRNRKPLKLFTDSKLK